MALHIFPHFAAMKFAIIVVIAASLCLSGTDFHTVFNHCKAHLHHGGTEESGDVIVQVRKEESSSCGEGGGEWGGVLFGTICHRIFLFLKYPPK